MDVNVACPYCGKRVLMWVDKSYPHKRISTCSGGCEREFVAEITVTIAAIGLKIEGEEEKSR